MLHAVVMAGGSGTRFWPKSRRSLPKQLLPLTGEQTLLQQTIARCQPLIPWERTWVVTGGSLAAETARQLPELPSQQLIIEPCARNTAPCIGLAAVRLLAEDPDATMLVLPADHLIQPEDQFQAAIRRGVEVLEATPASLVLCGVPPTFPATGFGYIRRGPPIARKGGTIPVFQVAAFREKPELATAEQYLAAGDYYWNCGIFLWKAATILSVLEDHAPTIGQPFRQIATALADGTGDAVIAEEFPRMPSISIDYAVLERANDVCVLEAPFTWDDVGSWEAVARLIPPDSAGNVTQGPVCTVDVRNTIISTTPGHLVAVAGLEDCLIVQTPGATLIARRGDEAALARLRTALEAEGLGEYL